MNKKGFTLIELLAVIVILAIIALIATPIILNVIDKAEKGALKDSAYGIIESGQLYYAKNLKQDLKTIEFKCSNNKCEEIECVDDTCDIKENGEVISYKGSVDDGRMKLYSDGKISICIENGKYAAAKLANEKEVVVNEGTCNYTDNYSVNGGEANNQTPSVKTYTVGEAVYLDPTNLSATCNASNSVSTTGTKTGCMKWYVIKDNGSSIDVLLDHNTTAKVAYETSGTYKEYAQASIKTQVDSDTTGWAGGLNPRLIRADEIASITNTSTFDGSSSTVFYFDGTGTNKQTPASLTQGASQYAWLFDYAGSCTNYGCNVSDLTTYGYWTSSIISDYSGYIWVVKGDGGLDVGSLNNTVDFGIRPVITINKNVLN